MPSYYQGTHTGQQVDAGLDIILAADRGIDALPEATAADHLLGVENGAAKKVSVDSLKAEAIGAYVVQTKQGEYYEQTTPAGTETGNEVVFDSGADGIPMKDLVLTVLRGQVQTLSVTVEPETIHLNQQVKNGDLSSDTSSWGSNPSYATLSASDNVLTLMLTNTSSISANNSQTVKYVAGHKYYSCFGVKSSRAGAEVAMTRTTTSNGVFITCTVADTWYEAEGIFTASATTTASPFLRYPNASTNNAQPGDTLQFRNMMIIDLTAIFGAGSEPTTVGGVKDLLPEDYYAYTLNTPLSRLHGQTAYGEYLGITYTVDIPAAAEGADLTWYVVDGKLYDNEGSDEYDVPPQTPTSFLGYTRIFSVGGADDDPVVGGITAEIRLDPTLAYNAITNAIVALGGNV